MYLVGGAVGPVYHIVWRVDTEDHVMVWATDKFESGGPVLQCFFACDLVDGDVY